MNRVEIKEAAKAKIKGNVWNLFWPMLLIGVIHVVINNLIGANSTVNVTNVENFDWETITSSINYSPLSFIVSMVFSVIEAAYLKYVIDFVRTGKFDANTIIECLKKKWINILGVVFFTSIITGIGVLLLVIPGIIAALGLSMAVFIVIDTDLGPIDCLKKSWEMMKGYKWNYFVLFLSFLGWLLLTPFTLGLLFIWLAPYMTVTRVLYYEKLKTLKKD